MPGARLLPERIGLIELRTLICLYVVSFAFSLNYQVISPDLPFIRAQPMSNLHLNRQQSFYKKKVKRKNQSWKLTASISNPLGEVPLLRPSIASKARIEQLIFCAEKSSPI